MRAGGLEIPSSEAAALTDKEGTVVATAPLSGEDGSLTTQDGRSVQTDAAEHATDVSNSGLWSLFD